MHRSKDLKIGAFVSYVTIAFNIIASLLYTPWMIQQLGDSDYGLYTLANSLITLFLFDFGLSAATSRFLSACLAKEQQDEANQILGTIYKLYLIVDVLIFAAFVVIFFLSEKIYVKLTFEEIQRFRVIFVISGVFAIVNFPCVTFNGILNSYEKFVQLKLADAFYRILTVLISVAALCLGGGLYALVTIHACVGLSIIIYKFYVIKHSTPVRINFSPTPKGLYKELFAFSAWITISTLAQRLIFNITPTILGIVANSTDIAVFGVITAIESYTHTISTAMNGMFMPRISRILNEQDSTAKLNGLCIKVGKWQTILYGLIFAGFVAFGKQFFALWMHNGYTNTYYMGVVLVMLPGMFYYPMQIANTALIVKNKVKIQAVTNVIIGVLNVVLSLFLAKQFGCIGACISIFVAYSMRNIGYFIAYRRILEIDIRSFFKSCYFRIGISVLAAMGVGFLMNSISIGSGWLSFAIRCLGLTAVYAVTVIFIGLNKEERHRLAAKIQNVRKKESI